MSRNRSGIAVMAAAAALSCLFVSAGAQTPADVAAKLSGTWKVNRELSPSIGRGRGRGGVAAAAVPRLVLAGFAGGRDGGRDTSIAQDLTPEQIAARAAMRQLQQIPETLKIEATPESIAFTDARATTTFAINNKSAKIDIANAKIDVKTKWDKQTLRQEFNAGQQKLTRTWSVDESGHLVLNLLVESMTLNPDAGRPTWSQQTAVAVFDRQQ